MRLQKTNSGGFNFSQKAAKAAKGLEGFPFIPISIFIVIVYYFGKKIITYIRDLINPPGYETDIKEPVSKKNAIYAKSKSISPRGYFINGSGVETVHSVTKATSQAEELCSILRTGKNDNWFNTMLAFGWSADFKRIESILNPIYPASYRRYVIESYRDIYTNKNSLQSDVTTLFANAVFIKIPETTRKYFIL